MFDFLLTTLYCAMWQHKLMPYLYLKSLEYCVFSFSKKKRIISVIF